MRPFSYFSLNAFNKQKKICFLGLFFISACFFLSYFFAGQSFKLLTFPVNDKKIAPLIIDDFLGDAINISADSYELSFFNLKEQMQISILEARPDDHKNDHYLEISLLEKPPQVVAFNEKVYLKYFPEVNGYEFSKEPTDVWFIPLLAEAGQEVKTVNIKVFAKYFVDGKEIRKEEELSIKPLKNDKTDCSDKDYLSLKEAKWLGVDLFEEMYGEKKNLKQRLLINGCICEVGKDDIIVSKNGKWDRGQPEKSLAIARLKSLTANSLEFEFWPKDSFKKYIIPLNPAPPSSSITMAEDFITDIHLRTQKQVSCKLEKQRMVMKEKDLFIKKDGKWKPVKGSDLKNEKNLGEFLVFDSIEIQGNNKLLKGYLFNKDRTQVVKVQKEIIHRKDLLQRKKRR